MSSSLMFALILILTIGTVIAEIFLFDKVKRLGKDTDAGLMFTRIAWIVIAIYISLVVAGLVYLCITTSFWIILLIIFLPLLILVGLVLTLSFGIYYLVEGNKGIEGDKRKISIGVTCLVINAVIVLAIGTLLILFMNGFIPIRLM